jgi:hypothetical protein
VAWINSHGSYPSQVLIPAAEAIPVPKTFKSVDALVFQAVMAEYLMSEYRAIGPGDRVLVHAAAPRSMVQASRSMGGRHGFKRCQSSGGSRFGRKMALSTMGMTTLSSTSCCL